MSLTSDGITYWQNGSTLVGVNPPITVERPEPYVVRISNDMYIPVNVLVWEGSEELAVERVMQALETAQEKDYKSAGIMRDYDVPAIRILKELKEGKLTITVERFDIGQIVRVAWSKI